MLPLVVLLGIIAIIGLIVGSIILYLTGLLIAFIFAVIAIMILYAFHEMEILNVERDHWLLATPFIAFAVGFGLDKIGVLQIQPLAVDTFMSNPFALNVQTILLWVVALLLVVDITVSWKR